MGMQTREVHLVIKYPVKIIGFYGQHEQNRWLLAAKQELCFFIG
jgi:hypothetical protein